MWMYVMLWPQTWSEGFVRCGKVIRNPFLRLRFRFYTFSDLLNELVPIIFFGDVSDNACNALHIPIGWFFGEAHGDNLRLKIIRWHWNDFSRDSPSTIEGYCSSWHRHCHLEKSRNENKELAPHGKLLFAWSDQQQRRACVRRSTQAVW